MTTILTRHFRAQTLARSTAPTPPYYQYEGVGAAKRGTPWTTELPGKGS